MRQRILEPTQPLRGLRFVKWDVVAAEPERRFRLLERCFVSTEPLGRLRLLKWSNVSAESVRWLRLFKRNQLPPEPVGFRVFTSIMKKLPAVPRKIHTSRSISMLDSATGLCVVRSALGGIILLLAVDAAHSSCMWSFDCTHSPCKQVPICDSVTDIPPPQPLQIAPIAPLGIPPIGTTVLPPIGTSSCRPTRICNNFGQCVWQTVCR